MINISIFGDITFVLFIFSLVFILISGYLDSKKIVRKKLEKRPFISFIISSYNDADLLPQTVESVFNSYDHDSMEVIVIDDCSKDNTSEVLKNLEIMYPLKVIINKKNIGKAQSINNSFDQSKGEVIFIVDSDVILTKEIVTNFLLRLQENKVGGVSCRYNPINKGFLAAMQRCEYRMLSLIQRSYNPVSTISFWGGCMAIKKDVFLKVGLLSKNCLVEDGDLALKIGEAGFKAQESNLAVKTYTPKTFSGWFRQKLRWTAGSVQNFLNHPGYFLKHPVAVFFLITYILLSVSFAFSLANNILVMHNFILLFDYFRNQGNSFLNSFVLVRLVSTYNILKTLGLYILYPFFSLPYVIDKASLKKSPASFLLVFPFSIVYLPMFSFVSFIGLVMGIYKKVTLKKSERGW